MTKQELEDFKKLPKEEQEKQKQEKLVKLSDLHKKLDQAIQNAIKTGELEEAKKLKEQLEKEIKDLEEQIGVIEHPELPWDAFKMEVTIGGKSKEELLKEMEEEEIHVLDYVKSVIMSSDFTTSQKQEHLDLVHISVKSLGFPEGATTKQIYKKAQEFGLELCPAEVGPHLRLEYNHFDKDGGFYIGMKPIIDSVGNSFIFRIYNDNRAWLHFSNSASANHKWENNQKFIFCLPHKQI